MVDISDDFFSPSAGFLTIPDSKYYDTYSYSINKYDYERRILGDATQETAGWYSDYKFFVNTESSWFKRGCLYNHTTVAGTFSFLGVVGYSAGDTSSRLVFVQP